MPLRAALPGDVVLRRHTGFALVVAGAVIPADVNDIPLAVSIAPVHVGGETEKPAVAWSAIWILMLLPLLVSLYQNFGIATIRVARASGLCHSCPRLQIVKRRAVTARTSHIGNGVDKTGGFIGSRPFCGTCAIPARAVDIHEVYLDPCKSYPQGLYGSYRLPPLL